MPADYWGIQAGQGPDTILRAAHVSSGVRIVEEAVDRIVMLADESDVAGASVKPAPARHCGALNAIRQYIADNPARWSWDTYHPAAAGPDPHVVVLWRLLIGPAR